MFSLLGEHFYSGLFLFNYVFIGNEMQEHFAPNSKFDFYKYIKRSMEDDFKKVLGIR